MTHGKIPDRGAAFSARFRAGLLGLVAASLVAFSMAGCSITFPLPSFMSDETTGSIRPRPAPFSPDLDAQDWRVAEPVLAQALKSKPSDDPARWSNPESGRGGAFQPVAGSFKRDGQTCRAFVARLTAADQAKTVQAIGCLAAGDAVFVDQVEPWKAL